MAIKRVQDILDKISEQSWKKLFVIALGVFLIIFLIKEIFFVELFNETKSIMHSLNQQFDDHSRNIDKFINNADKELASRNQRMDHDIDVMNKEINDFHKQFEESFQGITNDMQKMEEEFSKNWEKHYIQMDKDSRENVASMVKDYARSVAQEEKKLSERVKQTDKEDKALRKAIARRQTKEGVLHFDQD